MNRVEVRSSVLSCTKCSLHASSNGPVPFRGPDRPRLAIIAEAPGKVEDELKKPLVGPSGQKLSEWLARARINEDEISFLNAVSCYPNRTPSPQEVELCRPNMMTQLSYLSPEFLLVMGGVALSSFWNGLRMGDARGLWWKASMSEVPLSIWSIATYHPAAVLRNPSLDGLVMRDIMQVRLAMTLSSLASNTPPRPPSTHPSPKCVQCAELIGGGPGQGAIRLMTGEDVSGELGEKAEGGLTWCEKHDGLRMGTKGQGRKASPKPTTDASSRGSKPSKGTPRKRGARSSTPSTGSTDPSQASWLDKYRVK